MQKKKKLKFLKFFKNNCWILLLIIMVVAVVSMQIIPQVNAAPVNDSQWISKWNTFLDGFGVTIFDKMAEGYSVLRDFASPLDGNQYGVAQGVQSLITGLANIFVVLFMIIGIIKEGSRGEIDVDMIYWFRIFANTAIAVVMVTSITTIMASLYNFGDFIVNEVATTQITELENEETKSKIEDSPLVGIITISGNNENIVQEKPDDISEYADEKPKLNGIDFSNENNQAILIAVIKNFPNLGYIGTTKASNGAGETGENYLPAQETVPYLDLFTYTCYLPLVVALFLMYSAIFEIKIRQILAPLAVSTISFEGARGSGVRYLKKYLACFLKLAIYFLVAWIGYCLSMYFYKRLLVADVDVSKNNEVGSTNLEAPGVMDAIMMILSNIVCAMAMMQTGGIADEVIGA